MDPYKLILVQEIFFKGFSTFVDSVEMNGMVVQEEGFMEIAEAEKKVEQTKAISKYPARTFSGAGLLLNCIQPSLTLIGNMITLFVLCQ